MHRMQTEGMHVHSGGAGRTDRAKGYPSQTFVDLDSPHDDQAGGPSSGGGRRKGKEPMVGDTPSDLARDIGLGVDMGSTQNDPQAKKDQSKRKARWWLQRKLCTTS